MAQKHIEQLRHRAKLDALKALEQDGEIRASDLVDAARSSPEHPFHELFEWNDGVAAEKFRLEQARSFIRAVKPYLVEDGPSIVAPVYVRNPANQAKEQGYIRLSKVKTEAEYSAGVFAEEINRAISALQRAASIGKVLGFAFDAEGFVDGLNAVLSSTQINKAAG